MRSRTWGRHVRPWTARALAILSLVAYAIHPGAATGAEPKPPQRPQRWAILASPSVEKTGLPDLLTVDLSGATGIELVERGRIRAVTAELALSRVLGSKAVKQRLQLGRLLKADRLAILATDQAAHKEVLTLVISDCHTGARLWHGHFPFANGLKDVRAALRRRVRRTAARYTLEGGAVVGLSAFASENLVHDYDHLQASFAHVLGAVLLSTSDVTVVETEEAAAISKELTDGVQRTVPLFVKGSFTVVNAVSKKGVTFTVEVVLTRGPRKLATVRREKLPLGEVARFLRREVAPRVLKEAGKQAGQPLTEAEQVKELVARADVFTRVGDWEHAIGLREAALLLEPKNTDQRLKVMQNYRALMVSNLTEAGPNRWTFGNPKTLAAIQKRVSACIRGYSHLEYLIRNRQIDTGQAIRSAASYLPRHLPVPYNIDGKGRRLGGQVLEAAERAEEKFMTEVYPKALSLKRPSEPNHRYVDFMWMNKWAAVLVRSALSRIDRSYRTRHDLEHLKRILTQVMPDRLEVTSPLVQFLTREPRQRRKTAWGPGAATDKDWLAFLEALSVSNHQVAAVCGRYGLLYRRWWELRKNRPANVAELEQLLAETNALLAHFDRLAYASSAPNPRKGERLYDALKSLSAWIERTVRPPTPRPTQPHTPQVRTNGRLKFEAVELQLIRPGQNPQPLKGKRWRMYSGWAQPTDITRCGDRLDVMWNNGVLLFMRTKGSLEEAHAARQPIFDDVKWDGQNVWVGTRRQGIWVLDTSGKIIARIGTEEGLPPSDLGIRLHAVKPGKVCAVGSFGKHKRAWCAMVEKKAAGWRVNVFHEATRVSDLKSAPKATEDPRVAFVPKWICEYRTAEGESALLVGRSRTPIVTARPLQITLDSMKVSVFPHPLYAADKRRSCSTADGYIVEASGYVTLWAPPGNTLPNGKKSRKLCGGRHQVIDGHVLPYGGWFYVPGATWWRIKPGTWEEEQLVPGRLPNRYCMRYYGVSAHYGLVGWDKRGQFYRVTVLPAAVEPKNKKEEQ